MNSGWQQEESTNKVDQVSFLSRVDMGRWATMVWLCGFGLGLDGKTPFLSTLYTPIGWHGLEQATAFLLPFLRVPNRTGTGGCVECFSQAMACLLGIHVHLLGQQACKASKLTCSSDGPVQHKCCRYSGIPVHVL